MGALQCAEVSTVGEEPHVGQVLKLRDVPYQLPFGSDGKQPERVLRQRFLSAHLNYAMVAGLLPAPIQKAARLIAGQHRGVQAAGSENKMALKLFQTTAKAGDVEQALDVAKDCFTNV